MTKFVWENAQWDVIRDNQGQIRGRVTVTEDNGGLTAFRSKPLPFWEARMWAKVAKNLVLRNAEG